MRSLELPSSFESRHGTVCYGRCGSGPDVILVHGTPASSVLWTQVAQALADRYTLHYLDLPGYGQSAKFAGQDVRLRALAQAVCDFVRHLGIDRPRLVGHDFGAAAVLGAHLVEGLPVASITIANGVVLSPWGTPFSRHVKEHEAVFAAVPGYVHRAMMQAHLTTAMSRLPDADLMARLIEPWLGEVGQPAYYRQVGQYDYSYTTTLEQRYVELDDIPVAVLWGEQDRWVDISEGRRFAALVRGCQLTTLPDAGHFSMIDTPQLFARSLALALQCA